MMSNLQHTSIVPSSGELPSIFDLIAQENLQNLFHSAFDFVYRWSSEQYPLIQRLDRFKDAIYLGLHTSLDYFYLNYKNGLFSEVFYGMKRNKKLKLSLKIKSILFSIVLPYLKTKFDSYYEDLERISDEEPPKEAWKKLFLRLYPYFNALWYLFFWFFRFRFTFGQSDYHSPLLKLAGLKLIIDTDQFDALKLGFLSKISNLFHMVFTSLLFFVQFLSWYQNMSDDEEYFSEEYSKASFDIKFLESNDLGDESKYIEPPSRLSDGHMKKLGLEKRHINDGICPLCNQKRTNDCALSTCGFVFCYPCIFKYINKNKCCPFTKLPCNLDSLIRIYNS